MEIIKKNPNITTPTALILGFFDGVHMGHKEVIKTAVNYAQQNNAKTVLLTFKSSPAEFFTGEAKYIYPREISYKLIADLGVDYLVESNFSDLVNMSAENYLNNLIKTYNPISISTGFNHTFGANRLGNPKFLEESAKKYNYKYFCIPPYKVNNEVISSTSIKLKLESGNLNEVRIPLGAPFIIQGKVVQGMQLGRKLGFPTANINYPPNIVKLPYGVYCVKVFNKSAILNWGIKPTINDKKEVIEVHIPNFNEDLYGKELTIEFIKKIRDEKKFDSLEELKKQIAKDIEVCLMS